MLFKSHIEWHKLAESAEEIPWHDNGLCVMEIAGKKVTLVLYMEKVYAVAYKCPHAGGIMSEGRIDAAGNIVCPLHRYKFNVQNGRNSSGEGYFLKIFPIEIKPDGLYIGFEEKKWF
jgi:3-phenylpropionate/trans-cinnamate dioxygenase ferredoxin subunit